jgi:hypothetical protein
VPSAGPACASHIMISHTFVGQTAAAAPALNTAFYATAATVIPVLFLAIAVQGRALETVTSAATSAAHDYRRARRSRARLKAVTAHFRALVTVAVASLIVIDGVMGEITAMVALQNRKGGTETFVATAVVALTFAAAATPAVTFAKAFRKTMALLTEPLSTAETVTSTLRPPPTESGKND